jgi:YVTN family beta-propeller protein
VDTQTNTTVKTIPVGSNPTGMAINSVGTNLYVTEMGGSDSVTVIDTITDTVVTKIPVGTGEWPVGAQITPDDKFVYVAYYSSKGSTAWGGDGTTVGVIDTATNTVIATVTVGKGPGDIAIKKTIKCSDQHAVFDPKTGIVSIPAIDIPTLDPFTGESTGKFTVAKAQLSLFKGVEDFAFVNDSFSIISTDVVSSYPCHAQYIYADGKFSKGGTIHLPYVDVPSVIVIPPNTQIPGPVHVYDATLRQLALDSMIFHLADYKSLGTLKQ